ncbi:Hypothetical predicted protein [Pelobates cultripes]|uniref:Uncharacterized protein n=1 Tax=Pelobates cultripes TaxID=61616 RepID=A0AAD1WBS4_PELCU|nr:Hypothetical predicted protein [Pelobates cultripes]
MPNPAAPLTIRVLRNMLRDAKSDIKAHMATELGKQIAGLKEDMEAFTSHTTQVETWISKLSNATSAQAQDIAYFHGQISTIEDELEDLNNRSRWNNIRGLPKTVTPELLIPTLRDIFKAMAPKI